MNNFMAHYGVPGMRWGVRRFGEALDSGSRYETARRSGMDKDSARKKIVTENISTAKSISNNSSNFAKEGLKIHKSISDMKSSRNREDLSQLTDEELQAKIKRMNMEQQYANLSSARVSKGESYAKGTLEVAGSVLAIGSSALGIALTIKQLKGA